MYFSKVRFFEGRSLVDPFMATTNTWEVFLRCVPQPFTKLAKNSKARVAGASRHYSTSDRGDVTGGLSEKQGVGFKFLLFSPRKLGKISNLTDIFPILCLLMVSAAKFHQFGARKDRLPDKF